MVRTGADVFIGQLDKWKNKNIALLVNQTSCTSNLYYLWDVLLHNNITLKKIFTPEHGLFAVEQDQVPVSGHPVFHCPVISLYGNEYNSLMPNENDLTDIDYIVCDLQDVGSRFYTYINTMILVMKKINGTDLELVILDRPNPLGGVRVEGPFLDSDFNSFVGLAPVLVQHGLTIGEIALLAKEYFMLRTKLRVIKMEGWERTMRYQQTGLHWIAPSPNMPTLKTVQVFPGMCLLEGTNISEGRGTTAPFEQFGAPFIQAKVLANELNSLKVPGVFFRPVYFKPVFHKYANESINGIFVHVTEESRYDAFYTGIAVVYTLFHLYEEFRFLTGTYEFNSIHPAFDLLSGSSTIRNMIENNSTLSGISQSWQQEEAKFLKIKNEYHLYQ